jgi:hypothetical protein
LTFLLLLIWISNCFISFQYLCGTLREKINNFENTNIKLHLESAEAYQIQKPCQGMLEASELSGSTSYL